MQDAEELFRALERPPIRQAEPYDAQTIKEPAIKLSANENNYGLPPSVIEAATRALRSGNRYPDGTSALLREKLAARHGLSPAQVITSNGLDGLFTMLGRAFIGDGDKIVCGECTFGVYESTAQICGASVVKVPLDGDLAQNPDKFAAAADGAKIVFFCNPNNPTGDFAELSDVRRMIEKIPRAIVVLDEAYFEFTGEDESASFTLLKDFPNLIICRTFSKIYALAGLRLGWAAAHPEMLSRLYKVREPYCVSAVAEAAACAALDEDEYYANVRHEIIDEREKLCRALAEAKIKFLPSRANFVMIFPKEKHEPLLSAFSDKGIGVRALSLRGERVIRFSIGRPKENAAASEIMLNVLR